MDEQQTCRTDGGFLSLSEIILMEVKKENFNQEIENLAVRYRPFGLSEFVSDPLKGLWFSMTEINKLGINPKSVYDTPLGIYSYPFSEQYKALLKTGKLPFATDKKYIQFFNVVRGPVLNLNTYDESMLVTDREKLVVFVKQKGLLTFKDGIESVKVNNIFDINKPLSKVNAAYFFELVEQRLFDKNSDIINKLGINISTVDYANFVDALYMSWNSNFLSYVVSFKTFVRIFVDVFGGEGFKSTNSEAVEVLKTVYDDCVEEMNIRAGKPLEMSGVEKSDEEIQKQFDVWAAESILSTPAGAIWNITRNLGILLSKTVPVQPKQTYHGLIGKLNPRAMVSWTYVLRTVLGYVGAVDFGKGLIHRNEPTQAVWFSKDVCNVVDTVLNYNVKLPTTALGQPDEKTKEAFIKRVRNWFENVKDYLPEENESMRIENILKLIADGRFSSENISDLLKVVSRVNITPLAVFAVQKLFDIEMHEYIDDLSGMILDDGLKYYNRFAQNLNLSKVNIAPTTSLPVYYKVYCDKQTKQFFPFIHKELINSFNEKIEDHNYNKTNIREKLLSETILMFLNNNKQFFGNVQQFRQNFIDSARQTALNLNQQINQSSSDDETKQRLMNQIEIEMNFF